MTSNSGQSANAGVGDYVYIPPPSQLRADCRTKLAELLIWLADAPDPVVATMRAEITEIHSRVAQRLNTSFQSAAAIDRSVRDERKREFVDLTPSTGIKKAKSGGKEDALPRSSAAIKGATTRPPWLIRTHTFATNTPTPRQLPPLPSPKTLFQSQPAAAAPSQQHQHPLEVRNPLLLLSTLSTASVDVKPIVH